MDVVSLAELLGLAVLIALVAAVVVIAVRRSVLMRSGSVDVSWRFDLSPGGGSWVLGQALFHENQFLMYRSLSPLPGPARRLRRDQLVLGGRRAAEGTEPDLLPAGSVIIRCTHGGTVGDRRLGVHPHRVAVLVGECPAGGQPWRWTPLPRRRWPPTGLTGLRALRLSIGRS